MPDSDLSAVLRTELRAQLREAAAKVEHCVGQLSDAQVWWRPREGMNAIGNLLLHVCGNLRQRFGTNVRGEEDVRDRPREFSERGPIPKERLLEDFQDACGLVEWVLNELEASHLVETRTTARLQGEIETTVVGVAVQSLMHLHGHVQEIVCLTRMQLGDDYTFQNAPPETTQPGTGA